MRKTGLVRLVLAAGLVAVLSATAACSGSPGGQNGDKGEFIVYSADAANVQSWQRMLQAKFGDPNGVKVKIYAYQPKDFLSQFQNAVRSHAEVDGLILNGQNVGFLQSKGLLAPLDGVVDPATMQPAAADPFLMDGKHYAMGIGTLNTSMMAYNTRLVKKYHLKVPKTAADIRADVAKLKGSGVSLLGFGGATVFQWPMWYMQMLQQTSGDKPIEVTKKTLAGGEPDFTAPEYVAAMQKLKELGASGAFASNLMGTTNTAAQADFLAGKSAMYWYGSWVINQFVDQAKFPVDIAPFPSFVSGVTPRPVGGVTEATAMYSRMPQDKKDLARKFVTFLTSVQGDTQVMKTSPQGFAAPATKGVQVPNQTALGKKVVADYVPRTFTFLDWMWPAAVTTSFQQNIQAVVGQQKTPEAAMRDIQKTFESNG